MDLDFLDFLDFLLTTLNYGVRMPFWGLGKSRNSPKWSKEIIMVDMLYFMAGFFVGTFVLVILGRLLTRIEQAKTRKTLHPGKIIKIDDDLPELTEIDMDDIND